ncbi:MAG: hypothetical protein U9Q06_01820 [Nanoarchaeota archaeon]|nr:hypothetical protein [Nanoarchaeota archaeon]
MNLNYTRLAEKQLKKLNLRAQQRIIFELEKFQRGERVDIKKVQGTKDEYRIRIGNFRVQLIKIDSNIYVIKVGKRENFYLIFL